jgi:DNA-binding transcriptional LysR family regulator
MQDLDLLSPADLSLFVAAVEAGSLSSAARAAGLAPSSVQRRIEGLERALGARLLNRSSRGLSVTEAGGAFLAGARNVLDDLRALRESVEARSGGPRGRLRVAASVTFGRRYVAPLIGAFLAEHPEIALDLQLEDGVTDLVGQGYDLAVRIGRLPASELRCVSLAPVRRICCASPDYLARQGGPHDPAGLADHDGVVVAEGVGAEGAWRFLGGRGAPRPRVRVSTPDAACAAALGGAGVAHLPAWVVVDHLRSGELVRLLADFEKPADRRHAINLVWPKGPSAGARAFIAHLRRGIGAPPVWDRIPA